MTALASASVRSAAATSGRRCSNSDGTPTGIGGGVVSSGFFAIEKSVATLAEQHGNSMLILRARYANIDQGSLHALQRSPRGDHGIVIVDARVIERLRQIKKLLIGGDSFLQNLFQSILPANLEIILRQAGLFRKPLDFQIGGADLRGILLLANLIANLAPEIRRPGNIDRERHDSAGLPGIGIS